MMNKSVILIEDNTINTMFVKHVATQVGVNLKTFASATEALEAEYRNDVALVLLDCRLSDWNKDIDQLIALLREKIDSKHRVLIKAYTADICGFLDKNFDGDVKKDGSLTPLEEEFSNL